MIKYTISREANKKIQEDINLICNEINLRISGVISIILTGGFARGEGAAKKINGKFFPYNDYDIQIVSKEKVDKEKVDEISTEISRKLGYKGIINFYPFKKENQKMSDNFYIDLKCNTLGNLKKMLPRIRTVELKNNSMLLYGEDTRELIPNYKISDIPLSEGAKLLLDRISQMIEYYSTEGKHDKEFLNYIIQQAYASCCTSLLLLSGKYEIGYKKSMEIFKRNYKKDFPELYLIMPNLDEKIEEFIKWKTNPKKLPNENVEEEWFIARGNIIEVSKYFFKRFLNKDIKNIDELSSAILNMKKEFYLPYLKAELKNKTKLFPKNYASLIIPLVSVLFKYRYNKRLKKIGKNKFRIFLNESPELLIYSASIFIISSISKNSINKEILEKGFRILSKVYPAKSESWEGISLDYANAYISFFLQKI
jgi:predicted nucleotidyltransferase